jgi:hypothetical protein
VTTSKHGGQKKSGTAIPITVTGLTNGNSYTFTVTAINAIGTGPSSATSNRAIPSPPLSGVRSTASNGGGSCAVLSTGGVDCWGIDGLGNGTTGGMSDTPQPATGITDAVSVTSDGFCYCAVLSTGRTDCWGDNSSGEIGNGHIGGGYNTPQPVTGIINALSVTGTVGPVFAPDYCAVLSTGGADCWGDNGSGALGNGTTGGPDGQGGYDTPQAVSSL